MMSRFCSRRWAGRICWRRASSMRETTEGHDVEIVAAVDGPGEHAHAIRRWVASSITPPNRAARRAWNDARRSRREIPLFWPQTTSSRARLAGCGARNARPVRRRLGARRVQRWPLGAGALNALPHVPQVHRRGSRWCRGLGLLPAQLQRPGSERAARKRRPVRVVRERPGLPSPLAVR